MKVSGSTNTVDLLSHLRRKLLRAVNANHFPLFESWIVVTKTEPIDALPKRRKWFAFAAPSARGETEDLL